MCGGTYDDAYADMNTEGLSPRVRGNRLIAQNAVALNGTIPACAGEPFLNSSINWLRKDYPRVCGGTLVMHIGHRHKKGLSPRVRGNHRAFQPYDHPPGTIPACAGEPS